MRGFVYTNEAIRAMAEQTQKCNWCSRQKALDAFRWREFATGWRRIKTCLDCEPKNNQNRKEWVQGAKGQAWLKRTAEFDGIIESKREHRASELKRKTDETYRNSDAGKACVERKKQKVVDNPDLRVMNTMSSKMSSMSHGFDHRNTSKNVLYYTGFADREEVVAYLRDTADFDLDEENWHVDHIIAKQWYQFDFDGSGLVRVPVTEEIMMACWHRCNLQALRASENIRKCVTLPSDDELVYCKRFWPPHWKELPSAEYRSAMHRKVKAGRTKKVRL